MAAIIYIYIYIYIMVYPKSVNSNGQNFLIWNCWVLQLLWLGYPIGLLGCMFFSIIANAKKTRGHVLAGMMINRLIFTKIWSREKSREIERSRERVLCRTLKVHSETLKVHSETLKVNSGAIENREKSREIERNREKSRGVIFKPISNHHFLEILWRSIIYTTCIA